MLENKRKVIEIIEIFDSDEENVGISKNEIESVGERSEIVEKKILKFVPEPNKHRWNFGKRTKRNRNRHRNKKRRKSKSDAEIEMAVKFFMSSDEEDDEENVSSDDDSFDSSDQRNVGIGHGYGDNKVLKMTNLEENSGKDGKGLGIVSGDDLKTMNIMEKKECYMVGNCARCFQMGPMNTFCGDCRELKNCVFVDGKCVMDRNAKFIIFKTKLGSFWEPKRISKYFNKGDEMKCGYKQGMGDVEKNVIEKKFGTFFTQKLNNNLVDIKIRNKEHCREIVYTNDHC
jgi:hypothetical protein